MRKPLNILIVEDNPADAKILVTELRTSGFEPTWKRIESEPEVLADPIAEATMRIIGFWSRR